MRHGAPFFSTVLGTPRQSDLSSLVRGEWEKARTSIQDALSIAETPEALDGLSMAAGWLDDGATAFEARERAIASAASEVKVVLGVGSL